MGPDLAEEVDLMMRINVDDLEKLELLFDPIKF